MTYLASDNTSGVCPEIMAALAAANIGHAKSYGDDDYTHALTASFRTFFAHDELEMFPVFNGSAANCLGLAGAMKPFESIICHAHSHIQQDECGMPVFFTGGMMIGLDSDDGKISPIQLQTALKQASNRGVHHSRPRILSITQATEFGTIYELAEIAELTKIAREYGLIVHMDGARFANALVTLKSTPALMTWQNGVDILSFGGTKNGAMLAEAVVVFNPKLAVDLPHLRKRAGQLASKQRYISVQLLALLQDDLWRKNATNANVMAQMLANEMAKIAGVKILFPVQANEVFLHMQPELAQKLLDCGHYFYGWRELGDDIYRLVTNWSSTHDEIMQFVDDAKNVALKIWH